MSYGFNANFMHLFLWIVSTSFSILRISFWNTCILLWIMRLILCLGDMTMHLFFFLLFAQHTTLSSSLMIDHWHRTIESIEEKKLTKIIATFFLFLPNRHRTYDINRPHSMTDLTIDSRLDYELIHKYIWKIRRRSHDSHHLRIVSISRYK